MPYRLFAGSRKPNHGRLRSHDLRVSASPFSIRTCYIAWSGVDGRHAVGCAWASAPLATHRDAVRSLQRLGGRRPHHVAGIYYGAQYGGSDHRDHGQTDGAKTSLRSSPASSCYRGPARGGTARRSTIRGDRLVSSPARRAPLVGARGRRSPKVALRFGARGYFSLMLMGLIASRGAGQGNR